MGYYEHNEKEYRDYMKTYPPTQAQNVRVADILVERLKGLRFKTVFEIGAGYCLMTKVLMRNFRGKTYTCMDLSEDQVKLAKNYLSWHYSRKKVKIMQGDIIHYRSKKKYDLVFCSTVLSHIPEQYIEDAVANTCALSKKHIVIVEPTIEVIARLKRIDDQWLYDYETLFRKHGWSIADVGKIEGHPLQYMRFEKAVVRYWGCKDCDAKGQGYDEGAKHSHENKGHGVVFADTEKRVEEWMTVREGE